MKALHLKPLPAALLGLTLLVTVVSVALALGLEELFDTLLFAVQGVTLGVAGALVASRLPHNRMGWLFLALALFSVLGDLAQGWGLRAAAEGWPGEDVGFFIDIWVWIPNILAWVLVFVLFPDGRLPSRRWRFVPLSAALALVIALPGQALNSSMNTEFPSGRNPLATEAIPTDALLNVGITVLMVALAGSMAALAMRLWRSRGVERQQLKVFVFAATLTALMMPVAFFLWWESPVVRFLTVSTMTSLPIAACVAILRYRLYDVDRVIARTLVYATLTLALAAAFGTTALAVGAFLGSGSPWTVAAATLVAAAAFRPLRARLQDVVDRRFRRARYAALERVETFLEELRAGRAPPEAVEGLLREVLDDPSLELRFHLPESAVWVDARGQAAADSPDDRRERTIVERADVPLAMVLSRPADEDRPAILTEVLEAAGLAVEIARLRVDLRRHLDEVKASRARIVAAADEERRRIERDLHDGAQQRLVSIGLALRHAQHEMNGATPTAARALDGAVGEISAAIEDLRELARGVRPAQLDDGLAPALRELAARAPLEVEVAATAERFEGGLEAAAYFVAAEGLTNAIKHAQASRVTLSAARRDGRLVVTVADDGIGGAEPAGDGSGLAGLEDRVNSQGGALELRSATNGTTLIAELPCAP